MKPSTRTLAAYGLGVGVGLLLMGYAAQAYLWYGYMRANPQIGRVYGGGGWFWALVFVAGTVVAFTAFARGLGRVLEE